MWHRQGTLSAVTETQPPLPPPPPHYAPPINLYSILSLVFAIFVLPPLGIYFGIKAKQQIAQTGERGAELATAGIVTGWVLSGLLAVMLIIWCAFAVFFVAMIPSMESSY